MTSPSFLLAVVTWDPSTVTQICKNTSSNEDKMVGILFVLVTSPFNLKLTYHRFHQPGTHIFNLLKTWEKLVLAARIIASVENPSDVAAICASTYGQRAVLKFAHVSNSFLKYLKYLVLGCCTYYYLF
jgi:hypothetical protein